MTDAATFRRVPDEIVNGRNIDVIDEVFAEDYVEHAPVPPGVPTSREGVRAFFQAMLDAFPDLHFEVVKQLQDGDMHVGYVRGSGTMSGDFMGMPASGKSATWDEVHIARMSGGKLVEHWGVVDMYAMLLQLGFLPSPGG